MVLWLWLILVVTIYKSSVAESYFKEGATVQGKLLFSAREEDGYFIDNMEGIATHMDSDGAIAVVMVSDNNFQKAQETVVCKFAITGPLYSEVGVRCKLQPRLLKAPGFKVSTMMKRNLLST